MNDTLKKTAEGAAGVLGCIIQIAYLGMGLVQFAAIYSGVEDGWGLHWIIAGPLSFILAYIPIVGSAVGVWGAMTSWHWTFWPAFALFFWHLAFIGVAMIFAGSEAVFERFRK